MDFSVFDQRPVLVAVAGPNGAGKTTFYHAHLRSAGLRFINADTLALEMGLEPYAAGDLAGALRHEMVKRKESFIFETVFSDPIGDKVTFLREAAASGYTVVLCFIGISGPEQSEDRVAMRVSQGGHDVPSAKLRSRYPRILANLITAICVLPHVLIFDNEDLGNPFRQVAVFKKGCEESICKPVPGWLRPILYGG